MWRSKSKVVTRLKLSSFAWDGIMFLSGILATFILVYTFPIIKVTPQSSSPFFPPIETTKNTVVNTTTFEDNRELIEVNTTTFYDDPELSYSLDKPMRNWDEKRRQWLAANPSFSTTEERIVLVTSSQPEPCENEMGDHLLLRLFKNKVDYCRIHGCDVFYNDVYLHPKMYWYWVKYPLVKAAMIAHPEAEWIWWMDSDAVFTDMDFKLPLEEYKDYNLVLYGWRELVVEKNLSMAMNAGVFLIRNCQWSMDLLERWANHGPMSKEHEKWGRIQRETFVDKTGGSDDQAAICYLIKMEKERWGNKILLVNHYYFQGYWAGLVHKFENHTIQYKEVERRVPELRKRQAEKAGERYRAKWMEYLNSVNTGGYVHGSWRRPFVTHFTGCEPCSGQPNSMYPPNSCRDGMIRALNFADNQVLRSFGYTRPDLNNTARVETL